ncbi:MAG: YbjN domain-containing protein [Candidatus Aegiribacteria sp.]|nr:YbjN domain-containing protein [Candidatus Aegiribacteria sp.]
MKNVLTVLFVLTAVSFAEVSGDIVQGYLDQIGEDLIYERAEDEFMLLAETEDETQIPYMYILADPEMEGCLLVALTPGVVPESGAERTAALEVVSQLNWNNTWVKFAIDPESGDVSAMYTFSTENGLGYESFAVMLNLLLGTVDENWDTLLAI